MASYRIELEHHPLSERYVRWEWSVYKDNQEGRAWANHGYSPFRRFAIFDAKRAVRLLRKKQALEENPPRREVFYVEEPDVMAAVKQTKKMLRDLGAD